MIYTMNIISNYLYTFILVVNSFVRINKSNSQIHIYYVEILSIVFG